MPLHSAVISSPLGLLELTASIDGLQSVAFAADDDLVEPVGLLRIAASQLHDYFDGHRKSFTIPLNTSGTPWQESVWESVRSIPFGSTATYGQIALSLNKNGAARAVGSANGSNPVPIFTPCHRVIGASGALAGYRGGIERKAYLLELESGQGSLFPS